MKTLSFKNLKLFKMLVGYFSQVILILITLTIGLAIDLVIMCFKTLVL
jgi:hypothetical protein